MRRELDVVVVGSGPNGLAAAVTMAAAGLRVRVIEGGPAIGGGCRTEELTLPGFWHDVCSAAHPLAVASPFFHRFDLAARGAAQRKRRGLLAPLASSGLTAVALSLPCGPSATRTSRPRPYPADYYGRG